MDSHTKARAGFVLTLTLALAMVLCGCTGQVPGPVSTSSDGVVVVEGVPATAQPVAVAPPAVEHAELLGSVYELQPSGALPSSASLRFRLAQAVALDEGVAVVTAETSDGPWTYLPASLDQTRSIATVEVSHFSFFGLVKVAVQEISAIFKKQFMEALSGGLLRDVSPATCAGDPATNSYGATSKKTDALTWCLGYENGNNVLRITNTRRYPLQLAHPRLDVIEEDSLWNSWWKAGTWSRAMSGDYSVLGPGETITYKGSLRPGETARVTTEMDGFGLAMTALQVGVETALLFTGSAVGKEVPDAELNKASIRVLDTISKSGRCGQAVTGFGNAAAHDQDPNVGALLVDCLAAADPTIPMLGLITATSTIGGLIAFFAGQGNAIKDVVLGHDKVTIAVGRASRLSSPKQLLDAPVPSMCGHPAGKLKDGKLASGTDNGGASLDLSRTVVGQLVKGGPDGAVATISCSKGGVAWPDQLVFYDSQKQIVGHYDTADLSRYGGRTTVAELSLKNQVATVFAAGVAQKGDNDLWGTLTVRLNFAYDQTLRKVTLRGTQRYTERGTADGLASAVLRGNRAAAGRFAVNSVVSELFSLRKSARRISIKRCAGPFSDVWYASDIEYGERGCELERESKLDGPDAPYISTYLLILTHPDSSPNGTCWQVASAKGIAG